MLRGAVLCCARGLTATYTLVRTTGTAVPPLTLAHEEALIGMTDIYIPGSNRGPANAKSSMLHGKQTGRPMHVRTHLFLICTLNGTYLFCFFTYGELRCAVQSSRFNGKHKEYIPVHITPVLLFVAVYVRIPHKKKVKKTVS